jgi:putative colanic acid biosynthesis acetyltransferase WcaF
MGRLIWSTVWVFLFRPSPWFMAGWRRFLLRVFGAKIGPGAFVHSSARIWAPWNLRVGNSATLSWGVDCYNVAEIALDDYAIVSQYSHLCTASHDIEDPRRPVVSAPIHIGARSWVCADVFVGPGVKIGEGTVVGARSSVFRDLPPWCVAVGTPAKPVRKRTPVPE